MNSRNLLSCLAAVLAAFCVAATANGAAIWVGVGSYGNNSILIYDTNGNQTGGFTTAGTDGIYGMTLVGNQVWVDNGSGGITRYDQSGTSLGTITGDTFSCTTVIGNQAWAYGSNGYIYRYSFGGALLGQVAVQVPIYGLTQVGNVVWAGERTNATGYGVGVYDLNGNYLYGFLQ